MSRTRSLFRIAVLLTLAATPSACNVASSLEPEPPEPESRRPRIVKPKEMVTSGSRMPEPLR